VQPLNHLPNPQRSLQFLLRLCRDPGVRAAMRAHRFSVGLLTEMDPAAHTSVSADGGTTRVLGLNRNHGEVIELRLRTDAADGYRDYLSVRRTLCHELAHNVHGEHDRNFWDLCHQIEREVATADWRSGGRAVGSEEFAPERPSSEEDRETVDHGGWTGGEFVLGVGGVRAVSPGAASSGSGPAPGEQISRREILARAAEARIRNLERVNRHQNDGQGGGNERGERSSN
jgi:hypothetical protein